MKWRGFAGGRLVTSVLAQEQPRKPPAKSPRFEPSPNTFKPMQKRYAILDLGTYRLPLKNVAKVCTDFADMRAAHNERDVLIVSRNRSRLGSPWERGFVITVAHILEHFFGQKMQSLVAILANVAFDRNDITESKVNGVLRRKGVR